MIGDTAVVGCGRIADAAGVMLCRSKNNIVAEYALRRSTMPIGIAEWTTAITTELPETLASTLPRIQDLEAELEDAEPGRA